MNIIHSNRQKAFTLVELLIVIVIIGILAAISIVTYNGLTDKANDSVAEQELAQMYKHIKVQEVMTGEDFYSGNYVEMSDEGRTLSSDERASLENWLGTKLDNNALYDKSDDASIVIFYRQNSDEAYETVIYARSKSGNIFIHDGNLTRDNSTEEETAYWEEYISRGDVCVASPSTCVDPYSGDAYDWTAEDTIWWNGNYGRQYAVYMLSYLRSGELSLLDLADLVSGSYVAYYASDDTWKSTDNNAY